jgi:tetratricopeptide (TPR) repeat protein
VAAQTGDARAQSSASTQRARYVVESRRWEDVPLPEAPSAAGPAGARTSTVYGSRANQLVAAGFSAAHLGNYAKAEEAALRLRTLATMRKDAGSAYDAQPLEIMAAQVEGLSKFLKGDQQGGLEQLAAAAQLEERLDPPNGPSYPIKPSQELYAEVLLQAGRGREAQQAFEASLSRTPRRSLSVLGLARAALGNGDAETAAEAYGQLSTTWAAADPGRDLDEVKGFRPVRRAAAQP